MKHPDFTIVTDSATAESARKGFNVMDAIAKSDFSYENAKAMGFTCDANAIKRAIDSDPDYKKFVEQRMNDAGLPFGGGNIDALGQFFTIFNEQTINVLYRGRTAIQTFGVKTLGDWTTERVVFKTRELTAKASLYDDWTRAPYSGYNYGWDVRDTLRFEWGVEVTKLEEAVASVMRRNAYSDKKDAVVLNQSIFENEIFWNGFSGQGKKIYGVFNDPGIAARTETIPGNVNMATIFGTTTEQICAVLVTIKQNFANDLQGNGDINTLPVELVCPLSWQGVFTIPNTVTGYTAMRWLSENWPSATISFKPELTDKMIVFAKSVPGVGMDSVNLIRTSALRLVGAVPTVKGREESYSSSIAGAFISTPFGVKIYENGTGE